MFKVGDKVRVVNYNDGDGYINGHSGTVIRIPQNENDIYIDVNINFEDKNVGWENPWLFLPEEIEKI